MKDSRYLGLIIDLSRELGDIGMLEHWFCMQAYHVIHMGLREKRVFIKAGLWTGLVDWTMDR